MMHYCKFPVSTNNNFDIDRWPSTIIALIIDIKSFLQRIKIVHVITSLALCKNYDLYALRNYFASLW